jgi:hypothetical protein
MKNLTLLSVNSAAWHSLKLVCGRLPRKSREMTAVVVVGKLKVTNNNNSVHNQLASVEIVAVE